MQTLLALARRLAAWRHAPVPPGVVDGHLGRDRLSRLARLAPQGA